MKAINLNRGAVALIDDEDYDRVSKYKWSLQNKDTYAGRSYKKLNGKRGIMLLHNFIMGELFIDHADRNGLNNQKDNLRKANHAQQNANKRSKNKAGYRGVTIMEKAQTYRANIKKDKHCYNLGTFPNIEDAARAYNVAAIQFHGEFATLNNV